MRSRGTFASSTVSAYQVNSTSVLWRSVIKGIVHSKLEFHLFTAHPSVDPGSGDLFRPSQPFLSFAEAKNFSLLWRITLMKYFNALKTMTAWSNLSWNDNINAVFLSKISTVSSLPKNMVLLLQLISHRQYRQARIFPLWKCLLISFSRKVSAVAQLMEELDYPFKKIIIIIIIPTVIISSINAALKWECSGNQMWSPDGVRQHFPRLFCVECMLVMQPVWKNVHPKGSTEEQDVLPSGICATRPAVNRSADESGTKWGN